LSEKPRRAFLDSMVFIFGRLEECNSKLVLFLALRGEFEAVVSELVIEGVERFFRENFGRETGQILLQVIAPHVIRVVVQEGKVTSAVIDEAWDELNQEFLENKNGGTITAAINLVME